MMVLSVGIVRDEEGPGLRVDIPPGVAEALLEELARLPDTGRASTLKYLEGLVDTGLDLLQPERVTAKSLLRLERARRESAERVTPAPVVSPPPARRPFWRVFGRRRADP